MCDVVPLPVGQVQSLGHLHARAVPGADADVAVGEMDVSVVATSTKIGIHHAEQTRIGILRAKPELHRVLRLRHVDRHRDVLVAARETQRAAAAVGSVPAIGVWAAGRFRRQARRASGFRRDIAWLRGDLGRIGDGVCRHGQAETQTCRPGQATGRTDTTSEVHGYFHGEFKFGTKGLCRSQRAKQVLLSGGNRCYLVVLRLHNRHR